MNEWTLFEFVRLGFGFLLVCFGFCVVGFLWWYICDKIEQKKDRL